MKRLFPLILRIGLFTVFISYFIIAVIVNSSRIELSLHPLDYLHLSKIECIDNGSICLGTYPDEKILRRLKPATVVSVMNSRIPFSRELLDAERKLCKKLDITFISIPIPFFSNNPNIYDNLLSLLRTSDSKTPIYINAYLFDHRLETLKHRIIVKDKTVK